MKSKGLIIDCLNLELTTKCNLSCPFCYRAIYKKYDMQYPKSDFNIEFWSKLALSEIRSLILCGTFGDVIFYPHLLDFLEYVYSQNRFIDISINTNGSIHNTEWWKKLAFILKNRNHCIVFAVDGLEDTHKIHRIGSDFNTVIKNMKTAVDNGCNVVWQFIMFKHNEHQISQSRRLAKDIGCNEFIIRKSFWYSDEYPQPSFLPHIKSRAGHGYTKVGSIQCRIDNYNEVSITSNGNVIPCCHITPHNYKKFDIEPLNLEDFSLKEIIDKGYIQDVLNRVYKIDFCKRCIALSKNSYTVESLLLENLRMKRIIREREQKKNDLNKQ